MRKTTKLAAALLFFTFSAGTTGAVAGSKDNETCFSLNSADYLQDDYVPIAIDACTALIKSTSGNEQAAVFAVRGYWKTQLNRLDDALKDFDQAIEINPRNVQFYDYRADAWRVKGDLEQALSNYKQSISIDPTYAAAHFGAGSVYEDMGQQDLARQSYNACLAAPAKDRIGEWAHDSARQRLAALQQ
jgi:tetratricopeptide (TPR) repeat protein